MELPFSLRDVEMPEVGEVAVQRLVNEDHRTELDGILHKCRVERHSRHPGSVGAVGGGAVLHAHTDRADPVVPPDRVVQDLLEVWVVAVLPHHLQVRDHLVEPRLLGLTAGRQQVGEEREGEEDDGGCKK